MKKILADFKDDTNKIIIVAMIILTMFLGFIPSLIVALLLKKFLSDSSYEIAKALLNLEILFLLISLIGLIPILGWFVGWLLLPIMTIINIVVAVMALCSIAKKKEVNIPVLYEFI